LSGTFNLWIYPQSNLKLIPTGYTASITNNILTISSITNLPNYTYYYLNGNVFYIELISNGYNIDSIDISTTDLYFLAEENFIKVEQQYVSIIDNNSIEFICPDIDASNNNYYKDNARINSYYNLDFKNKDDDTYKNELDIIGVFAQNNNKFLENTMVMLIQFIFQKMILVIVYILQNY
jgi:hypothetical protein